MRTRVAAWAALAIGLAAGAAACGGGSSPPTSPSQPSTQTIVDTVEAPPPSASATGQWRYAGDVTDGTERRMVAGNAQIGTPGLPADSGTYQSDVDYGSGAVADRNYHVTGSFSVSVDTADRSVTLVDDSGCTFTGHISLHNEAMSGTVACTGGFHGIWLAAYQSD